jgi:TatA/E family protein of Tat protein translocase
MFGPLGVPELLFILVLALLIFGPKKLPEIGRTVGKAMGEFRRASNELRRTINTEMALDEEDRKPAIGSLRAPARDSESAPAGAAGAAAAVEAVQAIPASGAVPRAETGETAGAEEPVAESAEQPPAHADAHAEGESTVATGGDGEHSAEGSAEQSESAAETPS